MTDAIVHTGDCLDIMRAMPATASRSISSTSTPSFFTQTTQRQSSRRGRAFSFDDLWRSQATATPSSSTTASKMHRLLTPRAAIVFRLRAHANHIARLLLDDPLRRPALPRRDHLALSLRWSAHPPGHCPPPTQRPLLVQPRRRLPLQPPLRRLARATFVDQILQLRARDAAATKPSTKRPRDRADRVRRRQDRAATARRRQDLSRLSQPRKPSERVGYPTPKPILLLERIIALFSDPGDRVLDPFCGSGTPSSRGRSRRARPPSASTPRREAIAAHPRPPRRAGAHATPAAPEATRA
ncbi:MAG: hypothetical protein H6701_06820 [Myxococcales bacterium]|nr:hypothetical protein [Myxococcales bacterium]